MPPLLFVMRANITEENKRGQARLALRKALANPYLQPSKSQPKVNTEIVALMAAVMTVFANAANEVVTKRAKRASHETVKSMARKMNKQDDSEVSHLALQISTDKC